MAHTPGTKKNTIGTMKKTISDKTKNTGKLVGKYLIELLIVAFGVFLGVYIGNTNQQKKTDTNTRNTLSQIISELKSNSERLKSAIDYHHQIGIELDSMTNSFTPKQYNTFYMDNKHFSHNKIPNWNGVGTVKLSKSMYESAKISGVFQELNINIINIISGTYEYQDIYTDFSKSILDKFLEFNSATKTSDVISVLQSLTKYDILMLEKSLLKHIENNIQKLDESVKKNTYKK